MRGTGNTIQKSHAMWIVWIAFTVFVIAFMCSGLCGGGWTWTWTCTLGGGGNGGDGGGGGRCGGGGG